jgi:hypothetical protein
MSWELVPPQREFWATGLEKELNKFFTTYRCCYTSKTLYNYPSFA